MDTARPASPSSGTRAGPGRLDERRRAHRQGRTASRAHSRSGRRPVENGDHYDAVPQRQEYFACLKSDGHLDPAPRMRRAVGQDVSTAPGSQWWPDQIALHHEAGLGRFWRDRIMAAGWFIEDRLRRLRLSRVRGAHDSGVRDHGWKPSARSAGGSGRPSPADRVVCPRR